MENLLPAKVQQHLELIYRDTEVTDLGDLSNQLIELMGLTDKEMIENPVSIIGMKPTVW